MAKLTATFSVKDTEVFKHLNQIILSFISDERIDDEIRQEYQTKARKALGIKSPTEFMASQWAGGEKDEQ